MATKEEIREACKEITDARAELGAIKEALKHKLKMLRGDEEMLAAITAQSVHKTKR